MPEDLIIKPGAKVRKNTSDGRIAEVFLSDGRITEVFLCLMSGAVRGFDVRWEGKGATVTYWLNNEEDLHEVSKMVVVVNGRD